MTTAPKTFFDFTAWREFAAFVDGVPLGCVSHADDIIVIDGRAVEACLRCGSVKATRESP